ncbi:hypothetical protein D5E69_23325 (plasmid) [Rossellomorea marisflavi]|uniref:hypothetical protein n=1 Tax=Rossellomorea marisflavi TaxID=189381 RepID=UPI001319128A|nr:hypothetical protein [Rossellomorea marisflavi]QHA38765.1 hypothetical protein D5E69_23325 [Rossellomorea marisflavi]
MTKIMSIEYRKELLEELVQDKQLHQIICNYLHLTVLIEDIRVEEKKVEISEEMSDKKIREYVSLQSRKNYILHSQMEFYKNLIIQKCGNDIDLLKGWNNPKGDAIFNIHITNLLKNYNFEKNDINPYVVELLLYTLLNLDIL